MKLDLKNIKTFEELKKAKSEFYGKNSKLQILIDKIKTASLEEKKMLGKQINDLKLQAEEAFKKKALEIKNAKINEEIKNESIDVTWPENRIGTFHPLTLIVRRFKEWLIHNGYFETNGFAIENTKFNFEFLNIPKFHPARDEQDTLYISSKTLLRTHNTGQSARELQKNKNQSFKHFSIGDVFRKDEDDDFHSHQFLQLDLVAVGEVSFANLIWTLKSLLNYVLEKKMKFRLRPSYFPFTEPSLELDIYFNKKWIEILGAGMLNKKVLENAGYTNKMNGFAAGIGIERLAMIKYGIKSIRDFFKNDQRFLKKFKEIC